MFRSAAATGHGPRGGTKAEKATNIVRNSITTNTHIKKVMVPAGVLGFGFPGSFIRAPFEAARPLLYMHMCVCVLLLLLLSILLFIYILYYILDIMIIIVISSSSSSIINMYIYIYVIHTYTYIYMHIHIYIMQCI